MITLGKDKDSKYVISSEAKPGEKYYCIHCGCEMILKKSVLEKLYFARKVGQVHGAPECSKESENLVMHELELTNSAEFHRHILSPPNNGEGRGKLPGPPRGPKSLEERSLPVKSLEDLWNTGIALAEMGKTADGDISSILLCGERAIAAMYDNESIGPYAIKVRPEYYFRKAQRIRFILFITEHNMVEKCDKYHKKILDLHFADIYDFDYYVKKLFWYVENPVIKGMELKAKYEVVLIHGDWQALPRSMCKEICRKKCDGKWKCSGYQCAEVVNCRRQIFCPPSKKIK